MKPKKDALATIGGSTELALGAPLAARPRGKGPARKTVVARVVDEQSGVAVDVHFNAVTNYFEAYVPGYPDDIFGTEAGPVKTKVRDILRATREYQWKQSIVVDAGKAVNFWNKDVSLETLHKTGHTSGNCRTEHYDVTLAVRFYRLEIAPKPGDPTKFVCRPHVEDVQDGHAMSWRAKGEDVGDFLECARAAVLPYSPETWAAVQQVAVDILAVGKKIRDLLAEPQALAAVGARLLAAGSSAGPMLLEAAGGVAESE